MIVVAEMCCVAVRPKGRATERLCNRLRNGVLFFNGDTAFRTCSMRQGRNAYRAVWETFASCLLSGNRRSASLHPNFFFCFFCLQLQLTQIDGVINKTSHADQNTSSSTLFFCYHCRAHAHCHLQSYNTVLQRSMELSFFLSPACRSST